MAFLDDLYLILPGPARAREAMDVVTAAHKGIAANLGKTRVFNFKGGPAPALVADLGPDVWRGDPPSERGPVALGTPIGTAEFTSAWGDERLAAEEALLQQLPQLPDLQCAWLLLCYCAAPRANHALRTVPPALIAPYAAAHDAAVWGTLQACLGQPAENADCHARDIALLPADFGGLGLAQAVRTSPAAYGAAWPDGLTVLKTQCPAFAEWVVRTLECDTEEIPEPCLLASRRPDHGRRLLIGEGWREAPSWEQIAHGAQPPSGDDAPKFGAWKHGWQRRASRIRNLFFRDRVLLRSLPPSHRAMLRSQAGPHAGAWLTAIPSTAHTALAPKPCRSRCAAGCGCRSRWLRESAGIHPITDVGNALTTLETIRWRAPGPGCSLGALKSWNGLVAESRARPWALKGTSCRNNGSPTLPRRASPQMTGGDSIWSSMERRRWEGPSAAMPHWSRRCPGMACPTEEQLHGMGAVLTAAKRRITGHVPGARPRRRPNPLRARVRGRGTLERLCDIARAAPSYAREGPRLPCAAPPRRHGRGAGGASYRWQSSARLATRHWGGRVVEILALAPADAMWP